jgi:hypothetical protein
LSNASRLIATLSSIKELFTRTFDKNQLTKQRITILYNSSTYIIKKDQQNNKYICTVNYTNTNVETKEDFYIILDLHNKAMLNKHNFNKVGSEENEEFEKKKKENEKFLENLNKFSEFILTVRMLLDTLQTFIEKGIPFDYEYEAKLPEGKINQTEPQTTQSVKVGEELTKLKETLSEYEKKITDKYNSTDSQLLTFLYGRHLSLINDYLLKGKPISTHFLQYLTGGNYTKIPNVTVNKNKTSFDDLTNRPKKSQYG